jgi:uncharacterized protein YcbK (DUF882 family)
MIILVIALIVLGIIAAILGLMSKHRDGVPEIVNAANTSCATCDGTNSKCEQECLMEASTKEIEYFDDEELDAYKGKQANEYSDEEAEQFREVMYTMRQEEIKDWNRSLILRGINIPDQLKDEVIMLIGDNETV